MTFTIFWTVLCALGLARAVRLVVRDTWPPVLWLRMKWFDRFPPTGLILDQQSEFDRIVEVNGLHYYERMPVVQRNDGRWQVTKGHWLGDLVDCHHCFGGWAAIPAALFWYFAGGTAVASTFAAVAISPFVAILAGWAAFWFSVSYLVGRIS